MKVNLKVARMWPDAILPAFATKGAACFDLHAYIHSGPNDCESEVWMSGGEQFEFGTGLKFEVPEGYGMFVFPRSGIAKKHAVKLANCTGIIDSDYRGEVKIVIKRDADSLGRYPIHNGDRIAQACILPLPEVSFTEVSEQELTATTRGEGGFGSTGTEAVLCAKHDVA